jgi:type VI secretion system FHA domain protein
VNLTLEVVSANGQSLGPARRKVFGPEGGRIGRSGDCEWVLSNPYISRHHATVRCIGTTYYIESTGENGVAITTSQAMIPQRERRALKNGDRLFIDEYEISVTIGTGAVEPLMGGLMGFTPSNDPLADLAATARSPVLSDPLEPAHDELDPLKQLGGARGPAPGSQPPPKWNHTPGVLDQFSPPPVPAAPAPSVAAPVGIPDDWDKTSFGRASAPVAPPPAGGAQIPDDWDKTSFGRAAPQGSPQVPRPRAAPLPLRPASTPTPAAPPPASAVGAPASDAPPPAAAAPTRASVQPGSVARPTAPDNTGSAFDLPSLLRAAGVDPATVPPDTAESLGRILRTVVQGTVQVLQARAEVKDQFRLALTRIATAENNPLKFSVNAEDALNALLGRRNPAYLGPVEAFEDAFDDIRFHQMAMLAGMRAGFENALKRFDPTRLQEVFDKRGKRGGLLQMSAKSRYWELYADEFREMTADPEEAFKRLFGEEFASAYEQQLQELKRSRRKPPR